jgi:hypothetical protein
LPAIRWARLRSDAPCSRSRTAAAIAYCRAPGGASCGRDEAVIRSPALANREAGQRLVSVVWSTASLTMKIITPLGWPRSPEAGMTRVFFSTASRAELSARLENEMTVPGFMAEASVYATQYRYLTVMHGRSMNDGIALAGTCTCSDPGCDNPTCVCSCPQRDPCDARCGHLSGCNLLACECTCNGGRLAPGGIGPCPFHCVNLP